MNFEKQMETAEGKEELIIGKTEECLAEGEEQLKTLPEEQRKILEFTEGEKIEPLWSQIERKLAA
jgi:hypothetical protein